MIKEVIREYEKDRDKAVRAQNAKKEEIYRVLPRVFEIDREITGISLSAAKRLLDAGPDDAGVLVKSLADDSLRLKDEREKLLRDSGLWEDFNKSLYKCPECKDTGFIGSEKCACFKQKLISKFYEMSNLNKVLKKENFDTFNLDLYSKETDQKTGLSPRANMSRIWTTALNFVRDFDTEFNNLLFHGNTGLGKTFLCNCIAKELLDKGKAVVYVTSPQLFKLVEQIRFNKSDEETGHEQFFEMIMGCDLLIIDDLGTEVSTIVTASELFNIINTRLLNKKPSIISTNFNPSEFEGIYSSRITSRLFGNYVFCRFAGEDLRIKIRYKM